MKDTYLRTVSRIQCLHRQLLEVVKAELDRLGVRDINNVQCLLLFNIGENDVSVGELTYRGYYLGTNVTYNLKKMVEAGYVIQQRSKHDRRSVHVRLTKKGLELSRAFDAIFERHAAILAEGILQSADLDKVNSSLDVLTPFWGGSAYNLLPDQAA